MKTVKVVWAKATTPLPWGYDVSHWFIPMMGCFTLLTIVYRLVGMQIISLLWIGLMVHCLFGKCHNLDYGRGRRFYYARQSCFVMFILLDSFISFLT